MNKLISFSLIIPHVVFVTTLFWVLTLVGQYFYKPEDSVHKKENFECGFENTTIGESQIDFKNSIVMSFLILYDIELLLLLPISFNINYALTSGLYQTILVLFLIIMTCAMDLELDTLEYDN